MNEVLAWVSLIVGIVSIVVAVFAIVLSSKSEKAVQKNIYETKGLIDDLKKQINENKTNQDRFLSELDRKIQRIEEISRDTKGEVKNNINKVFSNQFPNQNEKLVANLIFKLCENPEKLGQLVNIASKFDNKKE